MEITTVKLHKSTKTALDALKENWETYEDVVNRLILERKNKGLKKELIKAYKNMGKKDIDIIEVWEVASGEIE